MNAEGSGGSIVNVASILGHRVAGNVSSYAASKAGVVRLTEALALEWTLWHPCQRAVSRLHRNRPQPRLLRERIGQGPRQAHSAAPA
ncbi:MULTISPECIES: SDR family NAD(P)-dependent oxidoreductase [unclassified Bradyrhizobium]|uniref:SDR family NAD(P)-dependent oxidoreductase n=1 Tax=unclassified Bradyrhizobium TaxID=2631580 RepID=UPI0024787982|nr:MULTISPECIES: SDR family NAD(P)-dependent oxidoreductase [unclassified Bradyrhizobium]WGS19194.1 SDR family NAD(P)-dependent oxidoreductase [Bradyrhizobium sp. ISRA463]WGS26030.1 SDR family NAD(P)-dependent oxidoreductase [Bradyrhizobium sp. ISRA464]